MAQLNIDTKKRGDKVTHIEFNDLIAAVKELQNGAGTEALEKSMNALKKLVEQQDDRLALKVDNIFVEGTDLYAEAGGVIVAGPISLTGGEQTVQRNLRIVNNLDSKSISASKGDPCLLNFTFVSKERYTSSEPYEDTGERGLCQISVKNAAGADYQVVKEMNVASGMPVSLDIAEFLTSGSNQVMIKVTGEVTEVTTPAFVYTVTLTSLSITSDNFKWWTAYAGAITLPLNIGGNIAKMLHVSVTGRGYNKTYTVPLGTSIYVETAYNYAVEHPGVTGVYTLSAYVSSVDETIRTRTVSFQVMCVVPGEKVKLVAVNHLLDKATNWGENALFDYAVYDGDEVTTSAQFVVRKDGLVVFQSGEDSIATAARHTFSFPMEIETVDDAEFQITAHVRDGETELVDPLVFGVNNSSGYSAAAGAVFYLNPRTRSNRQANRLLVVNEMDKSEVPCAWKGMNWGNDGWTADADGNKVLRLLAGAQLAVDYQPFATEASRTGKTIEIDYKVENVTDFTHPVLSIAPQDASLGLSIYADEIVMFSQSLKNKDNQSTRVHEGKRIRLSLVIMPDAYGNSGFNLCILYINGVKNREFTYESNDYFVHNGGIVIGSDYADIDVYGLRVYNAALTSSSVLRNYINCLVTTSEKAEVKADNDVMDVNGSEVDFENTKDQFNVFVFDNAFPSLANPNKMKGTLQVLFAGHPERSVSISNVEAKGQGTSSMRYWKWNVRFTLDKKQSVVTHADGSATTGGWAMVPSIAAATKLTAKKNFASSMQSHKVGSVNSVDDLYKAMGYLNEAMQSTIYKNARVSVYQLPFVAFQKDINEEGEAVYTFMGIYTMGPDKGDKNTFGYDTELFPGLIAIEGADNAPLATLFRVPWNARMQYNEDEEAFQYNGANAWDFGAGQVANIDKWIPAYHIAYACSNRLKPFDGTLEELNAQASTLRNEPYEFWIARAADANRYNVYYYEASEGKFIASDAGQGTINLMAQLVDKGYGLTAADLEGKTADQLNELFIAARVQKFRAEAPQYWDIDDAILHRNWVEFHAGTDNRAKNTYPYCFGNPGSKWKWRYDDLDTIFDVDNQGQAKKGYSVEFHDTYATGGSVWNGETSTFWNLLDLAFADEIVAGMRKMMQKMEELGGLKGGTDFDKLYAYFQKYYFAQAQEYFSQNLYNADAKFTYEHAKLAYNDGRYTNDTDPMTQALGDHYLAEQRWITKRILYMMSKYSFGVFSAAGTDNITVRAAGNTITYRLTPAMDLYPAIANGTSIIRGARTRAGEPCEMLIELSGSGDQQNTIQGASYLQDIGDWHDKNVTGTMIIQGRMLREVRLGHKTAPIVISISALTLSNCVSLQKLILSRLATLAGTLNLSACTHLKEVRIDGTSLTQLRLPDGGGLELVEFNGLAQYLVLKNYPLLRNSGVLIDECKASITDFLVSDCPLMQPMQLLVDIMNAQSGQDSHALQRIRAVGFDESFGSAMLDVLAQLADGTYTGLSNEGIAGEDRLPVLDGRITIHSNCYEDSVLALRNAFKKLELVINGEYYIRFADKVVQNIVASNWGDGDGITMEQAAKVTSLGDKFRGNSEITSFDELQYFTGITEFTYQTSFARCKSLVSINLTNIIKISGYGGYERYGFENCISLKEVVINPDMIEIGYQAFYGCTALEEIDLSHIKAIYDGAFQDSGIRLADISNLETLGPRVFMNCYNLSGSLTEIRLPFLKGTLGENAFSNSSVTKVLNLGSVSIIGAGNSPYQYGPFHGCKKLTEVILPATVTSIGFATFRNCTALQYVKLFATVPPTLGDNTFDNTNNCPIYVPTTSLNIYKTTDGWSKYASRIQAIPD